MYYIFFNDDNNFVGCVTNKKDRNRVMKQRPTFRVVSIKKDDIQQSLLMQIENNMGLVKYYDKWLFPFEEEDMFDATRKTMLDIHAVYSELFEYLDYVIIKNDTLARYLMILDDFGRKFEESLFEYRDGMEQLVDVQKIVDDNFKLLLKNKLRRT